MVSTTTGTRCSTVVERLSMVRCVVGSITHGVPLSQCSTTGITKAVVFVILSEGVMHIKEPLLLIENNTHVAAGGFLSRYLSWPLPHVWRHITVKLNMSSVSLNKTFPSFQRYFQVWLRNTSYLLLTWCGATKTHAVCTRSLPQSIIILNTYSAVNVFPDHGSRKPTRALSAFAASLARKMKALCSW